MHAVTWCVEDSRPSYSYLPGIFTVQGSFKGYCPVNANGVTASQLDLPSLTPLSIAG